MFKYIPTYSTTLMMIEIVVTVPMEKVLLFEKCCKCFNCKTQFYTVLLITSEIIIFQNVFQNSLFLFVTACLIQRQWY